MIDHCPTCGQALPDATAQPDTLEQLRDACRERGIWVSPDGRVREADAADLLGRQPKTLANWRYGDQRLPFVIRAGRALYALEDLARA